MIVCREEHAKAIDKAVFPMMQGGPMEHVIAAKAVCFKEAMTQDFRDYAERTVRTARALAQGLQEEGMRPVSGGTDSHLVLADLRTLVDGPHRGPAPRRSATRSGSPSTRTRSRSTRCRR